MILVYITCKDKKEAIKIASKLLEKKMIACANIFPITSVFKWKGKIQNTKEFVLLVKTNKPFSRIISEVKKIHSYDLPCILEIEVKANSPFERWVMKETCVKAHL